RPPPADAGDDRLDLRVGEHSAGALRERRHRGTADAGADDAADGGVVGQGQIERVAQGLCGSAPSLRPVAPGAIRRVERVARRHLVGTDGLRFICGLPREALFAGRGGQRDPCEDRGRELHRSFSSPRSRPDASIPARTANGAPCQVRMRVRLETTSPATIPNPNCETTNQSQSMRALSTGLMIPMKLWNRATHKRGTAKPARRMGRRGTMGSSAPYRSPTSSEPSPWIKHAKANELAWKRPISSAVCETVLGRKPAASRLIGYQMPWPLTRP